MIVYSRLEVRISCRTTKLVSTLSVDICVESKRRMATSGEFRPFHFRSIQFVHEQPHLGRIYTYVPRD